MLGHVDSWAIYYQVVDSRVLNMINGFMRPRAAFRQTRTFRSSTAMIGLVDDIRLTLRISSYFPETNYERSIKTSAFAYFSMSLSRPYSTVRRRTALHNITSLPRDVIHRCRFHVRERMVTCDSVIGNWIDDAALKNCNNCY